MAFTTDAGKRWASSWTDWESYDRFFEQMVRWVMRPINEDAEFTIDSEIKDGKVTTVIRALDKESSEFINNLQMTATATAPDMTTFQVPVVQVASGRYEARFDAGLSGDYLLSISPGETVDKDGNKRPSTTLTAGVTVPYSAEYRDRETNEALLAALAGVRPKGGKSGLVLPFEVAESTLVESNDARPHSFQHNLEKAISRDHVWPLFVLFSTFVFFADIFVRRVTISWEWTRPIVDRFRRRKQEERAEEVASRLDQLRSRKEQVASEIDERRRSTRFEPDEDGGTTSLQEAVDQGGGGKRASSTDAPKPAPASEQGDQEDGYTSRLLKAKNDAFKRKEDNT